VFVEVNTSSSSADVVDRALKITITIFIWSRTTFFEICNFLSFYTEFSSLFSKLLADFIKITILAPARADSTVGVLCYPPGLAVETPPAQTRGGDAARPDSGWGRRSR